ncbi:hypothetical protein [Streptomyces sp. NPDC048338]|uniref:hypothetical protein n=1 Tax=Streptomyces sp. NPDC048338 TaxID=3365536 RepID=UPI003718E01B
MAIQVGSVEVDVVPNTRGIYAQLRSGLLGPANRVGEDIGRTIGRHITVNVTNAIRDGVTRGGRQATTAAARQGSDAGGAFGRMARTRIEAALRSLPDIQIGANTSEADADIRALRVQLETLASQRVGIDVDAATARRQLEELERELTRLGASSPDVAVRINTAAAVGELAALRAEIDALDGRDVDVRVDAAVRSFGMLVTAAAAFGPAILPILPVVAAGLGAVAAAATAAGVGLGAVAAAAAPGLKDVAGALQAQKAAQDAATSSTNSGAAAAVQAQQRAIRQASATQGLAAAQRSAAQQISAARDQVARAERGVVDAEERLQDAQDASRRAQLDLIEARKSAARQLEDLATRYESAQLSQKDAALSLAEAEERQLEVAKDKKSTALDRERAALAVEQATLRLKEQTTETKRLKQETSEASKAGVEGSETVRDAQGRLADSQESVRDRTRAVADAQQAVVKAQQNVARVQQQAADSIASAQRQIASAQMETATSSSAAATAQQKYQAALAKMTPAARGTFDSFVQLRSAFSAWSRSLQPQVMPIFTRALDGIRRSLPGLTPFVVAAAAAIGRLQDRVSAGFKSPWWKQFKAELSGAVGPAIEGLGISFGRIFKGMAGVIDAFLPHMDGISDRMQTMTQRFATWGTSLKGSPAFERFLSYAAENGPIVSDMLGNLVRAFFDLGVALAPLAGTATSFLNAIAAGVSAVPVDVLTALGVAFASIAIGAKLAAIGMAIWRAAVTAAGIATAVMTGQTLALNAAMRANLVGIIITLIIALVVAIIYAYQHSETFRRIVQGAWEGIKATISFIWNNVLKPVFDALVIAFKAIGAAASWLWTNVLSPVFGFIGAAARILATIVLTVLIVPLVIAFKVLAAVGTWLWKNAFEPVFTAIADKALWLWNNVLKPVFGWIGDAAVWLWNNAIKPAFDNFMRRMDALGQAARWLWDHILSPVFTWIGDKGRWLWDKALKPAFDSIKRGVESVGRSFEDAKGFIEKAWNKVQDIAKKPVRFIIDKIYNAGIVPTWNMIAKAFGAPTIDKMETKGWARGGILPGQSSYRQGDDQLVPMRRGEGVYVSEAMRDPYERARLHAVNRAAMAGKPLDQYQGFAKGGIFDWVGKATSATVDLAKSGVSWLKDGVKASATAGLKSVVEPLIAKISGSASLYRSMISGIPKKMISSILGFSGESDKRLGEAGIGGGGFARALSWARTQAGLPYQWAGNGNPSWDCSGLVSAIESVIRGEKPHRRWATGAFAGKTAPPGWVLNGRSPYRIGITNAGVGHTAGTINGVNVESRGGDGVVIGSRARAWNDKLFTHQYAYQGKYDSGGYLQPGLNLAYNGTGRPEPVFTSTQAAALTSRATEPTGGVFEGDLYLDSGEFMGKVHGVVDQRQKQLARVVRAGRQI